jgi:hypothetical protein
MLKKIQTTSQKDILLTLMLILSAFTRGPFPGLPPLLLTRVSTPN